MLPSIPSDIPEYIYSEPILLAALAAIMGLAVHYQRGLTYREVTTAETLKVSLFKRLDGVASDYGRPLAREIAEEDFVTTVDATPRELVSEVRPPFEPNLTSTAKFLEADGHREWAHSQWAHRYEHSGREMQTHIVLFTRPERGTAVYAHVEASITDPEEHTEGEQLHGDVHQRFADAFTAQE